MSCTFIAVLFSEILLYLDTGKEEIKRKPRTVKKIGRNDLCPCGSGKKYKNCHGK